MERHRAELRRQLAGGERMYGVNTGYGADSTTSLASDDVRVVQRNTLTSHAAGTGRELPAELVRGMLLLKAHRARYRAVGGSPWTRSHSPWRSWAASRSGGSTTSSRPSTTSGCPSGCRPHPERSLG